ncbi:MAG: hypothetical protein Unbinned5350contig1001_23 [Prokaryotic dsDNA virus sp.]|nr:MAG: hypothetical protein Unbinned5350contig1001_23 [Prokaryotic dsDNA virus sp.]|tara:strand:- start:22899 stop:23120 length:222 start_codon:yes stop_codon:yes gene_type:complete
MQINWYGVPENLREEVLKITENDELEFFEIVGKLELICPYFFYPTLISNMVGECKTKTLTSIYKFRKNQYHGK